MCLSSGVHGAFFLIYSLIQWSTIFVTSLITVTNCLTDRHNPREDLFWLTVSEGLVHDCLAS
jgi:hypothetical protein